MPDTLHVHHFHVVGAVDYRPELPAVDLDVVAHVPEILDLIGVALPVDVAGVDPGRVIVVVERGFFDVVFWSMEIAGESPSMESTSGLSICPMNILA